MPHKHGLCSNGGRHPLFRTWCEMRYRCENPIKWQYKYYGGKGVTVCDRWQRFENFVDDMGVRPVGHTLDRIDRAGDYEPSNCRWASKQEQMNNHGINRHIVVDGESMTVAEAARSNGIPYQTLYARLMTYGWDAQTAATAPLRSIRHERAQRI